MAFMSTRVVARKRFVRSEIQVPLDLFAHVQEANFLVDVQCCLFRVPLIYSSWRPVGSRSRSYRFLSGNGGNHDSRRMIQLS
jgi:hypothetical protein